MLLLLLLLLLSGGRGPGVNGVVGVVGLGLGLELGMVAISVDWLELRDVLGWNWRNFQMHSKTTLRRAVGAVSDLGLDNFGNGSMQLKCLTVPKEG